MSSSEFEQARRVAFALPRDEQLKLAALVLAIVDGRVDSALEAAWVAAIEQRMADLRSGSNECIDSVEFIRRTRTRLRQSVGA